MDQFSLKIMRLSGSVLDEYQQHEQKSADCPGLAKRFCRHGSLLPDRATTYISIRDTYVTAKSPPPSRPVHELPESL